MKPRHLPPLDTTASTSSQASTSATSTPPTSASSLHLHQGPATSPTTGRVKHVSFCPLALLIDVAPEGETEPALVKTAQEQLGKRKVAMCAYSFEAPQIGEVAGKAWHSVLNGFQASLEPFLSAGSGNTGSVCVRSGGRDRDPSPVGSRRRASSLGSFRSVDFDRTGGRRSYDPREDDPFFTPNPTTRLTLKLPALRRECLRSLSVSPCRKPILRRCTREVSLDAACRSGTSSLASDDPPALFPPLSPSVTAPPPLAATHAENMDAVGALVPLAPCCAACETATHYGLRPNGPKGSSMAYTERWSPGARKKREEERKEREAREQNERKKTGAMIGSEPKGVEETRPELSTAASPTTGRDELEEREAEQAEEEARGSRLGLLAAKGGVDELALERGRRGTPERLDADHPSVGLVESVAAHAPQPPCEPSNLSGANAKDVVRPASSGAAANKEEGPDVEARGAAEVLAPSPGGRPEAPPSQVPPSASNAVATVATNRPHLASASSAPAVLSQDKATRPTASPAAPADALAPRPAPQVRPPKRRLSTATASFSRLAAAFGHRSANTAGGGAIGGGAGLKV